MVLIALKHLTKESVQLEEDGSVKWLRKMRVTTK